MIQQALNGMIALMLAKFVLNDVPHAAGLNSKKITTYYMRCPGCGYSYQVQLYREPLDWERCPICAYGSSFDHFVQSIE